MWNDVKAWHFNYVFRTARADGIFKLACGFFFFLSCKQTVICIQFFLITINRAVFVCFRLVDEWMFPGTSCCSLDHRC